MTDLLKSAFSYLSSAAGGTPKAADQGTHDDTSFVGQVVDISNHKLRVRKAIAEGGFGIVYIAQDVQNGKDYTIKRMFAHEQDRIESVVTEINFLRKLTGHVNIVEFIAAASDQNKEFLILTEFCSGGALVDHLQKQRLESFSEVLQVFYQICQAVRHMHSQNPPIIHRDLKIENLLLSEKYFVKLIDFGSATTSSYYPDSSWTGAKRSFVEDEMTRNTTPMYRPPEILDLYQNFPINEALDIWALGCVLYVLCFNEHPYSDSSKLRIVNANYPNAPLNNDTTFTHFHDLIRGCFMIDPRQRPKITDLLDRMAEFAEAMSIPLAKPLRFFAGRIPQHVTPQQGPPAGSSPRSPPVPRSASPSSNASPHASGGGVGNVGNSAFYAGNVAAPSGGGGAGNANSGLFGGQLMSQLKGQAGSLVKNIKDASNKVVDVVSSSVTKTDLDISSITSRILVMSQPSDGMVDNVVARNNIDEVRAWLDAKCYGSYAVFNLSAACKYRHAKFDNRVWEAGWTTDRIPPLAKLFSFCHQVFSWLSQKQQHIIVIHCSDGRTLSPIAVDAFLCFVGAFDDASNAAQLIVTRRGPCLITPSMLRYCQYIAKLRSGYRPHDRPFSLSYVVLKSVPIVNRQRTGCRPYIEVHCGDQLIHTGQREYDALRQYSVDDKTVQFPLNVNVFGDVTISIYHARSTITDRMQGKVSSIKICQIQFHTGFISEEQTRQPFEFDRSDVDLVEQTAGTFKADFGLVFELHSPTAQFSAQRSVLTAKTAPWIDYQFSAKVGPALAFSSPEEMQALTRGFKSGRGRNYQDDEGADGANAAGLLEESDDSAGNSPAVAPKQHHQRPPERPPPPAPSLPPKPDFPFPSDSTSQKSETLFGDAEQPQLPSRPRNVSDFQADFSIFSSAIDTSSDTSSINQGPLVDIWPGDPTPAANLQGNRNSGDRNSDSLLDIAGGVERQTSRNSNSSDNATQQQEKRAENPFLVDFTSDSTPTPTAVQPDLFGVAASATPTQQAPRAGGDDLFSLFTPSASATTPVQNAASTPTIADNDFLADSAPILTPMSGATQQQQQQQQVDSKDPFASILGSSGFQPSKKQPMGQMGAAVRPQAPPMGMGSMGSMGSTQQPRPPVTVMNPNAYGRTYSQTPAQPNSNRASPATVAGAARAEVNPSPTKEQQTTKKSDPFEDIFGSGSSKPSKPTSMGDMRKDQLVKDSDPETVKVRFWAEGNTGRNNIRALLSTLDQVLWDEGKARWEPVPIHMLVKVSDVKKIYKKAVIVIHPDKLIGTPNERMARLIFIELNEAWADFEKEAQGN